MTLLTAGAVKQPGRQTLRTSSYTTVPGCIYPAAHPTAPLVAGKFYLIWVQALIDSTNINSVAHVRVVHGVTQFDDSEFIDEPGTVPGRMAFRWWGVWQAIDLEDLALQVSNFSGSTVGIGQVTIAVIKLSDDLLEDLDWWLDENAVSTTLTPSDSVSNNASISLTPLPATDLLVLSLARHVEVSVSGISYQSKLLSTGTIASAVPQSIIEGEDGNLEGRKVHTMGRVYLGLGAVPQTFTEASSLSSAGTTESRSHSKVFALNLNRFRNVRAAYTEAEVALSDLNFATLLQSLAFTPDRATNCLLFGFWGFDADGTDQGCQGRLQVDGVDAPAGQESVLQSESHDTRDVMPIAHLELAVLDTKQHTVRLEGSASPVLAGRGANYRSLVAMSLELLPRRVRPASDVSAGGWTRETGAASGLAGSVDEVQADDADWIQSSLVPADTVKLALENMSASPPGAGTVSLVVRAQLEPHK